MPTSIRWPEFPFRELPEELANRRPELGRVGTGEPGSFSTSRYLPRVDANGNYQANCVRHYLPTNRDIALVKKHFPKEVVERPVWGTIKRQLTLVADAAVLPLDNCSILDVLAFIERYSPQLRISRRRKRNLTPHSPSFDKHETLASVAESETGGLAKFIKFRAHDVDGVPTNGPRERELANFLRAFNHTKWQSRIWECFNRFRGITTAELEQVKTAATSKGQTIYEFMAENSLYHLKDFCCEYSIPFPGDDQPKSETQLETHVTRPTVDSSYDADGKFDLPSWPFKLRNGTEAIFLKAVVKVGAIGKERMKSTAEVVREALPKKVNSDTFKKASAALVRHGFLGSTAGPGGGVFATELGSLMAKQLVPNQ